MQKRKKNIVYLATYTESIHAMTKNRPPTIEIADDLVSIILSQDEICLNRPIYIEQAVLDLSKVRMYELQYIELQRYRDMFRCEIKIMACDTYSFFFTVS